MSIQKLDFKKILNRLILFISLGVIAHIIFVLSTTEKSMIRHLEMLQFWHIGIIFILMILPWMGYAARIVMWSKYLGEQITFPEAVRVVVTADVASALSPTAVGGAPIKAALLMNRGYSSGNVGFMLTYGMIEDVVFYITGILLAGYFSTGLLSKIGLSIYSFIIDNALLLMISISVIAIYAILHQKNKIPDRIKLSTYLPSKWKESLFNFKHKITNSVQEMGSNFRSVTDTGKWQMGISIFVLFLQWMSKFSVLLVILYAFKLDFDTVQLYIRQWVIYVTMLFIPTPGATGGAEASFLLIFGSSIPKDVAFLIVSLWRLFTYYFILLTAVIFYLILSYMVKKEEVNITIKENG